MEISREHLNLAIRIGRQVSSKWASVETEDCIAYLNLWLVKNQRIVKRYSEEGIEGMKKLTASMHRAAHKYCIKEQTVANGGILSDTSFYSLPQIRRLLPYIWELDSWTQTSFIEGFGAPKVGLSSGQFDNVLAMLADVSGVFYGLSKENQELLTMKFRDNLSYKQIAKKLNLEEGTARQFVHRTIKRLQDNLGGTNPIWTSGNKHR